jgi:hypothetical protein
MMVVGGIIKCAALQCYEIYDDFLIIKKIYDDFLEDESCQLAEEIGYRRGI